MTKIFVLLFFCCCSVALLKAQNFIVKGVVADSNLHALPDAIISISKLKDTSIVQRFKSDKQGNFVSDPLNPSTGYLLSVEYLGYQTYLQNIEAGYHKPVLEISGITLIPSSTLLNTTVVEADRDPVKVKGDTVEFAASSYKVQPNSTADEILKKLPGLEVNKDGTVNAQGEQVKQIYVNGKKFFGTDPKLAMQNLPADAIESVQVFDERSDQSKFSGLDDGQRDKTINFRLKPRYSKGNFGNILGGYGSDDRFDSKALWNKFSATEQFSLLGMANDVNKQNFTPEDYSTYAGGTGNTGGGANAGGNRGGGGSPNVTPGFTTTYSGGVNYNNTASPKTN